MDGLGQARFLLSSYYRLQGYRVAASSQSRQLRTLGEPTNVASWLSATMKLAEGRLYWLLNSWVKRHPLGVWCLSHTGVGALTAATLLTEVDLDKCPSVLSLWRFSGLDPTCPKRGEGGKPRWNRKLRASCWSLGESFVRSKGNPDCYYGGVYAARRAEEQARSDSGALSAVAKATLATKRYRDSTEAYKHYTAGKLPPARLHARATRYAVKLFLSHYWEVAYFLRHRTPPAFPCNRSVYVGVPNLSLVPGAEEAFSLRL